MKSWICDDHQGEGFDPDCESCQSRAADAQAEREIDRRMEER